MNADDTKRDSPITQLANVCFALIEVDPHNFQRMLPCHTCKTIGNAIGRVFGCYNKDIQLKMPT